MGDIILEATSDFLYAKPSFIEGLSRIIDLGNTLKEYNESETPDEIATAMDWAMVGQYLRNSLDEYAKTTRK